MWHAWSRIVATRCKPRTVLATASVLAAVALAQQRPSSAKEGRHPWVTPHSISWCEQDVDDQNTRLGKAGAFLQDIMARSSKADKLKAKYKINWKHPLGTGSFGAVYLGIDRKTGEKVAVKKISSWYTDNAGFQREMDALQSIRDAGGHPNICGLRDDHYDDGSNYYLVLDLVGGGEMFDHLVANGAYSEADAARLVREVASALAFLHGIGCVHGDLKPENLMLSSDNPLSAVIKLVDFGSAQVTQSRNLPSEQGPISQTTAYCPPEILHPKASQKPIESSFDMWALGVILYIMLTGVHPFDPTGTATEEDMRKLVVGRKPPPLHNSRLTAHLSPSAVDLIAKLMQRNPRKRLTALEMLNHPWIRGDTARTGKIAGSDKKLSAYRKFKSKIEAKVFADMVAWSDDDPNDIAKQRTSLIERAFHNLDPHHKGYITASDLEKFNGDKGEPGTPENQTNDKNDDALSLSGFSDLLAEHMTNRYFPKGHVVLNEGDEGNSMFFINSGTVEVYAKDGYSGLMKQGDLFGEGALFHPGKKRSASIRCVTPVHAIEISREYFKKYVAAESNSILSLREKDLTRKWARAKTLLLLQQNLERTKLEKGEYLFRDGDAGNDLYILEEGQLDVKVKGHTAFRVHPGQMCGVHSLMFGKPRNTSAICTTEKCRLFQMKASDFFNLLDAHPSLEDSLRHICLRREFQKAFVLMTKKPFPTKAKDLRKAFDTLDTNHSGCLELPNILQMLNVVDTTLTEDEVKEILDSLDLDANGDVSYEEFKRIFGIES